MTVTIYTPAEGFTGVVADVAFDKGRAELDTLTASQRRYFTQAGYGIDQPARVTVEQPVDHPFRSHVGTALADASLGETCRVAIVVDGAVVYEGSHDAGKVAEFIAEARENVERELAPVRVPNTQPDPEWAEILDEVRGGPYGTEPAEGWEKRAQDALDAEQAKGDDARPGLVAYLEMVLDAATAPPPAMDMPNVRDGKADWVTWAIQGCGADQDEAAAMTKEALIKRFGKQEEA